MNNDLYDLLNTAHNGNKDSIIELYLRFSKLIKKFSILANYEEAETDLVIFLLEFISNLDLKKLSNYSQGELVNYIHKSLKNHTYNLIKHNRRKQIDEAYIEYDLPFTDTYTQNELYDFLRFTKKLTSMQQKIIIGLYLYDYTVLELASIFKISRQAVNQNKLKALELIKSEITTKGDRYII